MKILTGIDIPFIPFGGSPIICNDWYSNLPKDVEVRFLTLPPTNPGYTHWWTMDDVVFLAVEKKRTIEEFSAYIEKLKKELKKHIELYKPDVIHCQHLNFGFSRAIADLKLSIPTIGICHGTDVQIASKSDFFLKNMQVIRDSMDLLVFPAQKMADDYFRVDQCEKDYTVIPHGIPDKAFLKTRNKSHDFSKNYLRVLYAGRLTSYKGADIVISAMQYLKNDNVHLTIIGNEDEAGYKEKLHKIVNEHHITNITFQDQVKRENLWKLMNTYDLMVFPSTILEAFSLTSIEAQARGLAVMYAKAGGIENAVSNTGIVVEKNTPEEWAWKIKGVLNEPKKLATYEKLGYRNAEKHRISKVRDKYFEISQRLINQD